MTDVVRPPATTLNDAPESGRSGLSADALRRGIIDHLRYSIGRPAAVLVPEHFYRATALAVRDRMQDNWPYGPGRARCARLPPSGKFSSDRAIAEYCDEIWNVHPMTVKVDR
jgi:glucan phosphorylase